MSTYRATKLNGIGGAAAGNSTYRITKLVGSPPGLVGVITADAGSLEDALTAEPFDIVTMTLTVSGGVQTGVIWSQTSGPTVVLTTVNQLIRSFEAPAMRTASTCVFQAVISPGDVVVTISVPVWPANEFWLANDGIFYPRRQGILR